MTEISSEEDVRKLSDDELTGRLRALGEVVGPLTPTTRPLFESRLMRHLGGIGDGHHGKESASSVPLKQPGTPPMAPHPETAAYTPPHTPSGSSIRSDEVAMSFTPPQTPSKLGAAAAVSFYGVQVPAHLECAEEKRVFINKQEVLKFMKLFPGSRFKAFSSEQQAQEFADHSEETQVTQSPAVTPNKAKDRPAVGEGSAFRGPKPQDLVKLRKAIEAGNLELIKTLVWSNPRYLIGSGDTPSILQEGFRYNALHVVAMRNQAEAGRLLIDILEDEKFTGLMYPHDSEDTRDSRINFLVDLYLNTPDKGFCESPLHFACKFGHAEVVDLLASHPRTDKQLRNKYGELPLDIVCNRSKTPSAEVRDKIYGLLEDRVYVPLLRSEDNSRPAKIAKPWSTTNRKGKTGRQEGELGVEAGDSPRETPLTVRAYAGPMSPSKAEEFRKFWAHPGSPASRDVRKYLEIRRGDSEKGLERIGRNLAHQEDISWKEYWDFLQCFTDLSSADGLQKLEAYLKEQSNVVEEKVALDKDLTMLEEQLGMFHLSSNPTSPMNSRAVITDPAAIFSDKPDRKDVCQSPQDDLARKLFGDFSKSSDSTDHGVCLSSTNNNVISKNPFASSSVCNGDSAGEDVILTGKSDIKSVKTDSKQTTNEGEHSEDSFLDSSSQGSDVAYITADEDSDLDVDFQDCMDAVVFPDTPTRFYVMGDSPTKTDMDVLHALAGAHLSPVEYPYITRWKNQVSCYSEQTRASWHSPARKMCSLTTPRRGPGGATSRDGYYDSPSFENLSGFSSDSSASESDDSFRDVRANLRSNFYSP